MSPSRPTNTVALVVLWLLVVFDGYDLIVYGTVKPTLMAEWGLSQAVAGTLGSTAFLGMMIGAIAAGRLSDSLGRKRAVVWSTVLFTVATVLCGVVDDPFLFGALRLIAGLGLGGLVPSANALAAGLVSPHRRALIATVMMSGVPLGGSLAALVGLGVIPATPLGVAGWRWMFFIPLVCLIVLVPLTLRLVPESVDQRLAAADRAKAGHPAPGFGALLRRDMLLVSVLFALAGMGTMFAWYGLGTELPNLMKLQGAQLGGPLVFALVLNIGATLGSFLTAWGGDRFGPLLTGGVGSVLACIGLFVILNTPVESVGLIYAMLVLCGIGTHGTLALIIGAVTVHFQDHLRGTALGWTMGVGRLGAVLAPQVAGLVLGSFASPVDGVVPVFALFAGATVLAAICQFALIRLVARHPDLNDRATAPIVAAH